MFTMASNLGYSDEISFGIHIIAFLRLIYYYQLSFIEKFPTFCLVFNYNDLYKKNNMFSGIYLFKYK